MRMHAGLNPEEQLARLADGSLGEPDRGALERAVAESPELAAKLAEPERAIALTRSVDVTASAALHARVAALRAPRRRRPRLQFSPASGVAVVAGVLAIVFAVLLPGGSPEVQRAGQLALSRATLAAPAQSTADHAALSAAVDGVSFPDWTARGFHATGARSDALAGHTVRTVFYADGGIDVGYAIVAGAPLSVGPVAQSDLHYGVLYQVIDAHHATIVTWLRAGHTCVLASREASASELLRLAGWTATSA
jgi:anti-sigma factor RsiW